MIAVLIPATCLPEQPVVVEPASFAANLAAVRSSNSIPVRPVQIVVPLPDDGTDLISRNPGND
jgi:hypothetical protein